MAALRLLLVLLLRALPYISPVSPLYLAYISPISPLDLAPPASRAPSPRAPCGRVGPDASLAAAPPPLVRPRVRLRARLRVSDATISPQNLPKISPTSPYISLHLPPAISSRSARSARPRRAFWIRSTAARRRAASFLATRTWVRDRDGVRVSDRVRARVRG